MKNKRKLWIVSFCCISAGIVLLIAGLAMGGRLGFYINGTGVHPAWENGSSKPYVQEKMRLDEFTSIDIEIDYADLEIQPSDGYYIEYQLYGGNPKPVLEVKNQKLRFSEGASGGFTGFNFFAISGFSQENDPGYVALYVPYDQYFTSVRLKNADGNIKIGGIGAESVEIWDDHGTVNLGLAEPLKAYNLDLATEYGNIKVPGFPEVTFGKDDTRHFKYTVNADHDVKVRCDSGNIVIEVK